MENNRHQWNRYNIFLAKVPWSVTEREVYRYFSSLGEVAFLKIHEKSQNVSRIGKLVMKNAQGYSTVLESEIHRVDPYNEIRVERYLFGDDLRKRDEEISKRKIGIFGIYGKYISNEMIKWQFGVFGEVDFAYCKPYPDEPLKWHGFVCFKEKESAELAITEKFLKVKGKKCKIYPFHAKKQKKKGKKSYKKGNQIRREKISSRKNMKKKGSHYNKKTNQSEHGLSSLLMIKKKEGHLMNQSRFKLKSRDAFDIYPRRNDNYFNFGWKKRTVIEFGFNERKSVLFGGKESVFKIAKMIDCNHNFENLVQRQ